MSKIQSIKISEIVLDSSIYPRISIDYKRASMFEENMRDGFVFEPVHLQEHPDEPGKYRIRDGSHRFKAYRGFGSLQQSISKHLQLLARLPKVVNGNLKKGFTVSQVAEKSGWTESLVW